MLADSLVLKFSKVQSSNSSYGQSYQLSLTSSLRYFGAIKPTVLPVTYIESPSGAELPENLQFCIVKSPYIMIMYISPAYASSRFSSNSALLIVLLLNNKSKVRFKTVDLFRLNYPPVIFIEAEAEPLNSIMAVDSDLFANQSVFINEMIYQDQKSS